MTLAHYQILNSTSYNLLMQPTKQDFIKNYLSLTTGSMADKQQANRNILIFLNHPNIWNIARELLGQNDETLQFLGAQALYQKTTQQFKKMAKEQRQELKEFIFGTLFNQKIHSFSVINKLSSTCGFIACQMIAQEWPSIIVDLAKIMNQSYPSFIKGLSILEQIPEQCKNMQGKNYQDKKQIQAILLKSDQYLLEIFKLGLENIKTDKDILKVLQSLKGWCKFGLMVLESSKAVQSLLLHFNGREKMSIIEESLSAVLKHSFILLKVSSAQYFSTKAMLSSEALLSINCILSTLLNNRVQSIPYSYLLNSVIINYPWVLQNIEIARSVLEIMVGFLKSASLDIKYSSLLFFITIYQQVFESGSGEVGLRNIIQPYSESLYLITVGELKILSVNLLSTNMDEEEEISEDEDTSHMVNVTSEEFKYECSKLLELLYLAMKQGGSENLVLQSITSFLSSKQENDVELGIFILRSITHILQPSQTLSSVVTHIMNLRNGSVSVKIEAFRLIMTLDETMINPTEILNFVSQYFNNQQLSQHAIHTFYTLSNKTSSPPQQFWNSLLKILCQDTLTLSNPINLQKIISICFRIILKTQQPILQTLITTILRNSILSFQTLITSSPYPTLSVINNMNLISSILSNLNQLRGLFMKYSKQYCNTVINEITNVVKISLGQDKVFGSNNQLFFTVEIFEKCLNLVGPNLTVPITLITLCCEAVYKDQNNSELITILSSAIQRFSIVNPYDVEQVGNLDALNGWIESHFNSLDAFLISSITSNYDPDLIRIYFVLQKVLLQHNTKYTNQDSLNLAYSCFTNIVEPNMLKSVAQYIMAYLYFCKDEQISLKLLRCLFNKFQSSSIAKALVDVLQFKQQYDIRQQMEGMIRDKYPDMDQPQVQLLIRAFSFYIMGKDVNSLRQIFMNLEISNKDLTPIRQKYEYDRKQGQNKKR